MRGVIDVAVMLQRLRFDDNHPSDRAGPVALASATVVLGASFLPWATSGSRARTSYELAGVAVRFDLVPSDLEPFARLWFLRPARLLLAG